MNNWNAVVEPMDLVIHLGDFSLGKFKHYSLSESVKLFRNQLAGNIWFVRGNHDNYSIEKYLNTFQSVVDSFEFEYQGKKILFTHKPEQNIEVYDYNIHGHIHSKLRDDEYIDFGYDSQKHKNVAADLIGFRPRELRTIIN